MNDKSLLILGAGSYGVVAYEVAKSMNCFDKIDFVDDDRTQALNGCSVIGKIEDVILILNDYSDFIVAIGNADVRLDLINRIKSQSNSTLTKLISPKAFVSESAFIGEGSVIEPMATVGSLCKIGIGCYISSGAVIGHESVCCDGVHIDVNATVTPYKLVSEKNKVVHS